MPNSRDLLIENVRTELLAFDDEFGRHRKGAADATADFLNTIERLASEAGDLQLGDLQRHLAILAGENDSYLPRGDFYDPGVQFDGFQHPIVAEAVKRLAIISAKPAGTAVSLLQTDFYERAIALLTQLTELINESSPQSPPREFVEIRTDALVKLCKTVGDLFFEAEALQVGGSILLALNNFQLNESGYVSVNELSRLLAMLTRRANAGERDITRDR